MSDAVAPSVVEGGAEMTTNPGKQGSPPLHGGDIEATAQSGGSPNLLVQRKSHWLRNALKRKSVFNLAWLVGVIILESIIFDVLNSRYMTVANLQTIGYEAAFDGILAVGLTFAMICNTLDISFASVAGLVGMVVAVLASNVGLPLGVAVCIGILAGAFAGFVNGVVIVFAKVPAFIVTLAVLFIAYGIQLVLSGGNVVPLFGQSFHAITSGYLWVIPLPVVYALVLAVVMGFVLRKTVFGAHVIEVGSNEEATRRFGVRIRSLRIVVLVIVGVLAGIVGVLITSELSSASPSEGSTTLLTVIAAVVLGGTSLFGGEGSIIGSLLGVLFITALQNGLILAGVNPNFEYVVTGLFLLGAVTLQFVGRSKDSARASG